VLIAAAAFGGKLDAARAARAIGRGLRAGDTAAAENSLETDVCTIETAPADLPKDFDARMRRARAVVIAAARLDHETLLRGEAVSEIATRARQAGVPCYAVAGSDGLDPFEARILDLQIVLEAGSERELTAAGRELAAVV
jgi:glycerate kinase